jgi:diacylglycerol kinase family enzyme
MRVSLLYNKNAGDAVPLDLIRDTIAQHGHELVCAVKKQTEVERLLERLPEIVVAAGGRRPSAPVCRQWDIGIRRIQN